MRTLDYLVQIKIYCLFSILLSFVFFIHINEAWAGTTCSVDSPTLRALSQRLDRAESPRLWRTIYKETDDILALLRSKLNQSTSDLVLIRTQLTCAHTLLLESAYFLSDDRVEGRLWAMRSIGHAVSLSSLSQKALSTPTQKERLRLLLRRVNHRSKSDSNLSKLSRLGTFTTVSVPAQSKPYQLTLSTLDQSTWLKRCGLLQGCKQATAWTVYPQQNVILKIKLPISKYQIQWSGPCVETTNQSTLTKKRRVSIEFSVPPMSCMSSIEIIDKLSAEPLSLKASELPKGVKLYLSDTRQELSLGETTFKVPENSKLSIEYPGYQSKTVKVPSFGRPLRISLLRCAVPLHIKTSPSDVHVTGPKKVYWGRSYLLTFERKGYISIKKNIIAPQPKSCSNPKQYMVDIKLPREVEIKAYNPQGLPIKLSYLSVSGLPLPKHQMLLRRPEGAYEVLADTHNYPRLTSVLKVPSCETDDCIAVQLDLQFKEAPPSPITTATQLKWLGASAIASSLGLIGYNWSLYQHKDQELSYAANLSSLQNRMNDIYRWSTGLLIGGLTTHLLGYAWPALTSEQTKFQDRPHSSKAKESVP